MQLLICFLTIDLASEKTVDLVTEGMVDVASKVAVDLFSNTMVDLASGAEVELTSEGCSKRSETTENKLVAAETLLCMPFVVISSAGLWLLTIAAYLLYSILF